MGVQTAFNFLFIVFHVVFAYHEDYATYDSFHKTSNDYGVFDVMVSLLLSTFRLLLWKPLINTFSWLSTHSLEILEAGEWLLSPLGPLHTWAKNRDHEIVRAQKKVFKGRPKTP